MRIENIFKNFSQNKNQKMLEVIQFQTKLDNSIMFDGNPAAITFSAVPCYVR